MRSTMRDVNLGRDVDLSAAEAVGFDEAAVLEMYRLLAIAKYDERYVVPAAHTEQAKQLEELGCSLDFDEGPGMYGSGPFGEASGQPVPVAVENFHALKARQTSEAVLDPSSKQGRVNLLNWDGKGSPTGIFPGGTGGGR
jgi:nitrate reductase beta subunit